MSYVESITEYGPAIAYCLVFLTLFAECGLLIGFFLPGDTLLFGLGLFAAAGRLELLPILLVGILGAVLGHSAGYLFGRRLGPQLFSGKHSWLLNQEHLKKAEAFYAKYGKATIVITRFVPIVRTFAPVVAGAVEMPYPTFLAYNITGGIGWVAIMTLLGYYLGTLVPGLDRYIELVFAGVVVISLLSSLRHILSSLPGRSKAGK